MSYFFNGITFLDKSVNFSPQGAKVSISCDAVSDLPTAADIVTDYDVTPLIGSTAQVVNDSAVYIMNSGGTWIKSEPPEFKNVYTKAETDAIIAGLDAPSVGGTGAYIQRISETNGIITATVATIDTAPASGSNNPISSGGVYLALSEQVGIGTVFGDSAYDLDDYKTAGIWHSTGSGMTATGTHVPAPIQDPNTRRGFRLEVRATSTADYVTQIVFPAWNANLPNKYYIRHYRGTGSAPQQGWSNWFEYAGTDTGS